VVSSNTLEISVDSSGGDLRVVTLDSDGGVGVNSIIHCVVYRLR